MTNDEAMFPKKEVTAYLKEKKTVKTHNETYDADKKAQKDMKGRVRKTKPELKRPNALLGFHGVPANLQDKVEMPYEKTVASMLNTILEEAKTEAKGKFDLKTKEAEMTMHAVAKFEDD